jgi:hypothetical protein
MHGAKGRGSHQNQDAADAMAEGRGGGMTRSEKIAEARTCPICDWRFTPTHGKQKYCSAECAHAAENARKRKHENAERRPCPNCGQPMGKGSRYPSKGHWTKCEACRQDAGYHRAVQFISMREKGLTNIEIERRLGLSYNTVAVTLNRASRYGLTVPAPPYWLRGAA